VDNNKDISIMRALNKESSDFRKWEKSVNKAIITEKCPKCGSIVVCAYADMGTTEFCDTYNHICLNAACDYLKKKEVFNISMGDRDTTGAAPCPFCGRKVC
jgi:hypothetical protein